MNVHLFVFACFIGFSIVSCQLSPEFLARRAARQCAREQKVSYDVAFKFSKGDFSDDSLPAKCFLKCFAYKLKFFNLAGEFNKEELMTYTKFVVPDSLPTPQIFEDCEAKVVKGDDNCEYIYQAYKCFWDGVTVAQELRRNVNSVRFSLYDTLRLDRLSDEEEVEANLSE